MEYIIVEILLEKLAESKDNHADETFSLLQIGTLENHFGKEIVIGEVVEDILAFLDI